MGITSQSKIVIVIDSQSGGAIAGLNATQKAIQGVQKAGKSASAGMGQFGSALSIALSPVTNLGVALRQVGQALQGVSFLATAFITVPLVAALKSMANEAINFDDALVRAQKTTGLLDSEIGRLSGTAGTLSGELRTLAQSVATPIDTLAKLAEQAGQLGLTSVKDIMKFVRVAEIMGQTTDVAAEDALLVFGRLSKALGVDADRAGEYILQLANTINMLENTTTASASNIVTGMRNAISAASGFKIAGADLAGFIASLYEMGINADEAGTMFSRMAQYVATRADRMSVMTGKSVAEIRQAFDKDFVGGMTDVIRAIGDVESEMEQTNIAVELFGMRAARGVVLLANAYEQTLIPNLQRAREEFNNGTSIIDEYVRAMSSTKAQIGIMQNNLKVLGVTIGDTFLPVVNAILKYFVPAIQMATEAFAALTPAWQMGILAAAAFLAALGPLTMIFGTLLFSIGIAITGFVNLATTIAAFGGMLAPVITSILSVGAALVGLAVFAKDAMISVRDVIQSYANAARSWGNNLVANLAAGMLEGMVYVINAALAIANTIARFLASFSPPKAGPLRDILNWGANLIDTYIQGFGDADFSAIEDITNRIGRYFKGISRLGFLDEKEIIPAILDVRHAFTELLAVFNETGKISDELLGRISSGMGEMGDKIAEYLRLQLKVNSAQKAYDEAAKKLREIRDLREQINRTFDKEVRSITKSGKPLLEQLSLIVTARNERDESLAGLDDQEAAQEKIADAAEQELDVFKEQLDAQKGLIDYYLDEIDLLADQEDLLKKISKLTKAAAGSASEFAGALSGLDFGGGIGEFEETIKNWEDLLSGIDLSVKQFAEGRKVLEAFFKGLFGEEIVPADVLEHVSLERLLGPEAAAAYTFGRKIYLAFDEIKTSVLEFAESIKTSVADIEKAFNDFDISKLEGVSKFFDTLNQYKSDIIGLGVALGIFALAIANFGKVIKGAAIIEASGGFASFISQAAAIFGEAAGIMLKFVGKFFLVAILIGAFVAAVIENFDYLKTKLGEAIAVVVDSIEKSGLKDALKELGAAFGELWKAVVPILVILWRVIVEVMGAILRAIADTIVMIAPFFVDMVTGIVQTLTGLVSLIAGILNLVTAVIEGIITGDWSKIQEIAMGIWEDFKKTIVAILRTLGGAIAVALGGAVALVLNIINQIYFAITGKSLGFIADMAKIFAKGPAAWWSAISKGLGNVWTVISTWISKTLSQWWGFWGKLLAAPLVVFGLIRGTISQALDSIKTSITNAMIGILNAMGLPGPQMLARWSQIFSDIVLIVETLLGRLPSYIFGVMLNIFQTISTTLAKAWIFWKNTWDQIAGYVAVAWTIIQFVVTTATHVVEGVITQILRNILGIWLATWGKVFGFVFGIWREISTTVVNGMLDIARAVRNGLRDMFWDAVGWLAEWLGFGEAVVDSIKQGIMNRIGAMINALTTGIEAALDAAKRMLGLRATKGLAAPMPATAPTAAPEATEPAKPKFRTDETSSALGDIGGQFDALLETIGRAQTGIDLSASGIIASIGGIKTGTEAPLAETNLSWQSLLNMASLADLGIADFATGIVSSASGVRTGIETPLLQAGTFWQQLLDQAGNVATAIDTAKNGVVTAASGVKTGTATPLTEAGAQWGGLAEKVGLSFDDIIASALGLPAAIATPIDEVQTQWDSYAQTMSGVSEEVGTSITDIGDQMAGLETLIIDPLANMGVSFTTLETTSATAIHGVMDEIDDFSKDIASLEDRFDTSFTTIDNILTTFKKTALTVKTDVSTYIDNLKTKIDELKTETETKLSLVITQWNTLSAKILQNKALIVGYIGDTIAKYGALLLESQTDLPLLARGMEEYAGAVNLQCRLIIGYIQDVIDKYRNMYEEVVHNSYVPDTAQGVIDSFSTMVDTTRPMIFTWVADLLKSISGLSTQTEVTPIDSTGTEVALGAIGDQFTAFATVLGIAQENIEQSTSKISTSLSGIGVASIGSLVQTGNLWETLSEQIGTAIGLIEGSLTGLAASTEIASLSIGLSIDNIITKMNEFVTAAAMPLPTTGALESSVIVPLANAGTAFAALATTSIRAIASIVVSSDDLATNIIDLDAQFDTSFSAIDTILIAFKKIALTVKTDVSTYIDNLKAKLDELKTKTDTQLQVVMEKWRVLSTKIGTEKGLIVGYIGSVISQGQAFLMEIQTDLPLIDAAWENTRDELERVSKMICAYIQDMIDKMKELYDQGVGNSYIPDLATGVVDWMTMMVDKTQPLVSNWAMSIAGDMSDLSAPTGTASLSSVPRYAPEMATALPTGPLIQIDRMIVPNQGVARTMADELADRLGKMAGRRRTGS